MIDVIYKNKDVITITNSMGVNGVQMSLSEYHKVSDVLKSLTEEELLDLRHMIRYPAKKVVIELEEED